MRTILSVMLASLLVLPSPVFAQEDVAAILRELPPGTRVRLDLEGGTGVIGTVKEARPDALVLERAGFASSDNRPIPADESGGVRVAYSSVTKATVVSQPRNVASKGLSKGAKIGIASAVIGGVVLLYIWYAVAHAL
jgi:hypothetical protein